MRASGSGPLAGCRLVTWKGCWQRFTPCSAAALERERRHSRPHLRESNRFVIQTQQSCANLLWIPPTLSAQTDGEKKRDSLTSSTGKERYESYSRHLIGTYCGGWVHPGFLRREQYRGLWPSRKAARRRSK